MAFINVCGFLVAAVFLTLMPGPDILFVITQSINRGKKAGIVFASGLCTGLVFHVTAVTLGLSALLAGSAFAFTVLKIAGGIYLFYLGGKAFFGRNKVSLRFCSENIPVFRLFRRGIWMNLLNPKVILFFLAFFPQFIDIEKGSPEFQMLFLGILFILQALCVFSGVALLADKLSAGVMKNPGFAYWMNIVEAFTYFCIGISIFWI